MKRIAVKRCIMRDLLVVALFVMLVPSGFAQSSHTVMYDGNDLYVDGTLYPNGTIVDDGDSTGNYSNGFYGTVIITANVGDSILLWGTYDTEDNFDRLMVYSTEGVSSMLLSTYMGQGTVSDTSCTGRMTMVFSTDGSAAYSGFVLHYEVRPSNCSNVVTSFTYNMLAAVSVNLRWTAVDTTTRFFLHYGSIDTVVSGVSYRAEGLTPNTSYVFDITPLGDTGIAECTRSMTLRTKRFPAVVRGLRPLCVSDTLTLTADSADGYWWSTGATTRSIDVWDTGWYSLVAFTSGGLTDTLHFHMGGIDPDIETRVPETLCAGDSALITVGMAAGSSVQVLRGASTLSESSRIFLPDGVYCDPNGCSYRSELEFSGFENDAHISDINDIRYVMLNIEHSYVGDIYINITCPNSQSADILRYGGSGSSSCNSSIAPGSRGWQSGNNVSTSTYLGIAADHEGSPTCDSTAYNNEPGTGWRYCWSNCNDAGFAYAPGDALIYRSANYNSTHHCIDSSNVEAGTNFYHPDNSFASLIGCPMNGIWYIEVIDGWSGDNGYIFGWELALNPNRLSRTDYVPTVAYADLLGGYASRRSDTAFMVTAPLYLASDTTITYTVLITDSLGCVFDTTITITFLASSSSTVYDTVSEINLPHTFGGRQFNAEASNVTFHYPNSSGCDSLVVYNLHVLHNSYATFDTSLCASRLPIQWYHRTFYAAGTQHDTIANHLGADSILTLTLHAIQPTQIDIYDTICSNQSLTFEGTTYTNPGNYPHNFLSNRGCDSTRTLHLTVLNTSHRDTTATACDSFFWHDSTYTVSTSNALFTTLNSVGCDSNVALHLTVNSSYSTNRFDTICGGDSVAMGGQYYSTTGSHTHLFASQQGCDSLVEMLLQVLPITYGDYYDTCLENSLPRHFGSLTAWGDTTATLILVNSQQCDSLLTYHLHVLHNSYATFDTSFCANYFPLQWFHTIFYTGGTQYDTIENHLGADSILTLTMHVLPTHHDTIAVVACDSYAWHDSTYTASTLNAQFSTSNSFGCDSTETLHLTLNYSTDTNIIAEACDSYSWFGTNYLVPPVVPPVHTLTNAVGCDSIMRLAQLTLHYSHQIYDTDTVCLYGLAEGYLWHDTLILGITASSSFSRPLTDQYGCDSLLYLTLSVFDSTSSQVFDTIVQNQAATWQYGGIPLSTDTTLQVTLTNHWGCDSLVTYHLHVWQNVYTTVDTTVCDDLLPTFTWNGLAAADTLVATLVGNHGVDSVVTLHMHVNPTYHIDLYDTICDNTPVTFAGQTINTTGDYGHAFQTLQGCDSLVTLHLTVNPTYSIHFYDTIYLGDTVFFEGNGYIRPGNYPVLRHTALGCDSLLTLHIAGRNLHHASLTDTLCEGDTLFFCDRAITEEGVYIDTIRSGDFLAGDTVVELTLHIVRRPEASIIAVPYCDAPAHYTLQAHSEARHFLWVGPAVAEGHEHDSLIAVPSPADMVRYTLYADYRAELFCPAIVDTLLPPVPVLHALIDVRPSAITLDERNLVATHSSSGPYTKQLWYVFYNDEAPFTDTAPRLRLNVPMYVDSLDIVLNIANDICNANDTAHVDVLRADILFPNVFTPSLATNNIFRAYTTAVSEFELWIYDRRGNLVFHTTDLDQGWDGTHDGVPLPQAAYVYKCRYRDELTPTGYQSLTGIVTLLR